MSMVTVLLVVLLALNTTALIVVFRLYRQAKKANKVRRVEAPNSQYKSPYVLDLESKDRWESLELERLHEVNREEVVKLLGKVRALGVRGLSGSERDFLDRMADAHDTGGSRRSGRGSGGRPRRLPRPS